MRSLSTVALLSAAFLASTAAAGPVYWAPGGGMLLKVAKRSLPTSLTQPSCGSTGSADNALLNYTSYTPKEEIEDQCGLLMRAVKNVCPTVSQLVCYGINADFKHSNAGDADLTVGFIMTFTTDGVCNNVAPAIHAGACQGVPSEIANAS